MDTVGLLLKDPPFWAAAAAFVAGLSAALWSGVRLKTPSAPSFPPLASRSFSAEPPSAPVQVKDGDKTWTFPPPEQPPAFSVESPPPVKSPAAAPSLSFPAAPPHPTAGTRSDPAVILSMVEEKFLDLTKRIASLEHPKVGQAPAYLDPLLKRFQEMENELKNMKFAFTQLASAQNAININDVTAKIQGIQKVLENLTSGTDVGKPS